MNTKVDVARLFKTGQGGKVRAFIDLVFNDEFTVKGFRIIDSDEGDYFVGWPQETSSDGKHYNVVYPLKRDVKEEVEKILIDCFKESEVT